MKNINDLHTTGKSSRNIQSKKTKGFGYQVLGFGSGGAAGAYVTATGGTPCAGATCGDYKIHTFTGDGTLCVSAGAGALAVIDYMVIAGGGGGGGGRAGGGGGGGFRESVPACTAWAGSPLANPGNARPVAVQGYPITVGGGGPAGAWNSSASGQGSTSTFSDIDSAGGGPGGGENPTTAGGTGGSGGGSAAEGPFCIAGNTPPVSPPQGQPSSAATPGAGGATGGGATQAGQIGAGGAGATTSISASPTAYAGGGGSGNNIPSILPGGVGGGGPGGGAPATAGTTNLGGGGGGGRGTGSRGNGGAGGSGIVIIRYKFQ